MASSAAAGVEGDDVVEDRHVGVHRGGDLAAEAGAVDEAPEVEAVEGGLDLGVGGEVKREGAAAGLGGDGGERGGGAAAGDDVGVRRGEPADGSARWKAYFEDYEADKIRRLGPDAVEA